MLVRTISGAVFVLIVTGAVIAGPFSFLALFFLISLLSQFEFYKLIQKYNVQPAHVIGLLCGITLYGSVALELLGLLPLKAILTIIPLITLLFISELYRNLKQPFLNVAASLLGIVYAVVPFVLLALLAFYNGSIDGYSSQIILGILILQWTSDTGQYLSGRAFGKTKLFERISPKKTWEGLIGGIILSVAGSYIIAQYFLDLTLVNWIVISILIVICGTLGDLTESMLKRSIDVKDSGNIMPGHGGMLDRFDGLIGAIPFIYFYIAVFC